MRSGRSARSGELIPRGTYSIADDARATFAAERDEQRRDWLASLWPAATVVAVAVTTLVYVFLLTKILPFRYWDAVCVVTIAILPAELALASSTRCLKAARRVR